MRHACETTRRFVKSTELSLAVAQHGQAQGMLYLEVLPSSKMLATSLPCQTRARRSLVTDLFAVDDQPPCDFFISATHRRPSESY